MTQPNYNSTQPRSNLPYIFGILLLLGGAFVGYTLYTSNQGEPDVFEEPPPPVDAGLPEAPEEPSQPATEVIEELEVDDALDEWLAVPGIVQRLAAATWRVSNGDSPSSVLRFLSLSGRFDVVDEGDDTYVDPKSYRRYDALVDRIVSVDPQQAANAYTRLRPNFEAAFRQIAEPGQRFHGVAQKAVARVLAVKVPKGRIKLIGKGATFFYADESLESLSPADKHVLRLGPKNAARLQTWLRKMAAAAKL
ncbi:MAG: DUF3014 domain-containing protein [Myxococcota bacterium]